MSPNEELITEAQKGSKSAIAEVDKHDDWLVRRRTGVGGSDVSAILGLNPWKKPIDVQQEKLGLTLGAIDNEAMHWGRVLEPVIADEYQRRHSGVFVDGPFDTKRSDFNYWHLYTVDRLVLSTEKNKGDYPDRELINHGLEIKARGWSRIKDYGLENTDHIPQADLTQGIWYMAGLRVQRWDWAVLFNTHDYREYTAERDKDVEAAILEKVEAWWMKHVVNREPCPADGSDQFAKYLRGRYSENTDELVIPTDEERDLIHKLRLVEQHGKAVESAKKMLRQRLQLALKDAAGFDLDGEKGPTFKFDSKGRANYKAIAEELARRLEIGPKTFDALCQQFSYKPSRKWRSPTSWQKDQPLIPDNELLKRLDPADEH